MGFFSWITHGKPPMKNIQTVPAGTTLWSDKEIMKRRPDLTKVAFPCDEKWKKSHGYVMEKMWVIIKEGDTETGVGILDNECLYIKDLKLGDTISYENRKFVAKESEWDEDEDE